MESKCLSKEDVELFYKLHWSLLFYANSKLDIIRGLNQPSDFAKMNLEDVLRLRDIVYKRKNIIDKFIKENPFNFEQEELNIIEAWKNQISGKFFVLKHCPEYTIVMGGTPTKLYGIVGLKSPLSEMIPSEALPLMINVTLLPFRDQIIYDGLLETFQIHFGANFRKSIEREYRELELKKGIITSFAKSEQKKAPNDEELMKFYMKTKDNRERYSEEAFLLSQKSPELKALYHRELGRAESASLKQKLRRSGVKEGTYFAILDDTIIASGMDQKALEQTVKDILPEEKWNWIFIFKC